MYDLIKHSKFIYEYQNCASVNWCNHISAVLDAGLKTERVSNKHHLRNNLSYNITQSSSSELQKINSLIYEKINKCHEMYVDTNKFLLPCLKDLQLNSEQYGLIGDYVYRRYDKHDNYEWHADKSLDKQFVFSYLLYLNDDFQGGDTLFLHEKLRVVPKMGSILCFPCDLYMTHKSTRIITGTKRIIWTCLEIKNYSREGA